jgi:hypothetical protein
MFTQVQDLKQGMKFVADIDGEVVATVGYVRVRDGKAVIFTQAHGFTDVMQADDMVMLA